LFTAINATPSSTIPVLTTTTTTIIIINGSSSVTSIALRLSHPHIPHDRCTVKEVEEALSKGLIRIGVQMGGFRSMARTKSFITCQVRGGVLVVVVVVVVTG